MWLYSRDVVILKKMWLYGLKTPIRYQAYLLLHILPTSQSELSLLTIVSIGHHHTYMHIPYLSSYLSANYTYKPSYQSAIMTPPTHSQKFINIMFCLLLHFCFPNNITIVKEISNNLREFSVNK